MCYDTIDMERLRRVAQFFQPPEETPMVDKHEKNPREHTEAEQAEGYTPRPAGQVWAARAGLVLAIGFVIWQVLTIARGGL